MWHTRGPGVSRIGIDIGHGAVRAAQLKRSGGTWSIRALADFPRANPGEEVTEDEIARVLHVLHRNGFSGVSSVVATPTAKLLTGLLELPPRRSGAPLTQMARSELARMHSRAPDSFEMICWDLPAPPGQNKVSMVMAIACDRADANTLLDTLEAGGLDVAALDVQPWAVLRACSGCLMDDDAIHGLLSMGSKAATLEVVYRGTIVYQRATDGCGLDHLYEGLGKKFGFDRETLQYLLADPAAQRRREQPVASDEALSEVKEFLELQYKTLAHDLGAPLRYTSQSYPDADLGQILLTGGGALLPGLAAYLTTDVRMKTTAVSPADLLTCPKHLLPRCHPSLTMAVGLAMHTGRAAA